MTDFCHSEGTKFKLDSQADKPFFMIDSMDSLEINILMTLHVDSLWKLRAHSLGTTFKSQGSLCNFCHMWVENF